MSRLPTTDLYFLNSCGDQVGRWWRRGPIERLSDNCFRRGDALLLIRRDTPEIMERAITWPGRMIYLIDDDIEGAAASAGLPSGYRERLARFARDHFDRLLRRADWLVASSQTLADSLRADPRCRAPVERLDPFWSAPIAGHDSPSGSSRAPAVVHLGSASHHGGLRRATPAILAVLDRIPLARFTFFAPLGTHPGLEAHMRVRRLDPMRWPRYARWLPRQRFDLALYPLEPTAFDRARSSNKLIEHAIIGAAGVYPASFGPATALKDGAILAEDDPAEWAPRIVDALARPEALAACAARAAMTLRALDTGAVQRKLWWRLLDMP